MPRLFFLLGAVALTACDTIIVVVTTMHGHGEIAQALPGIVVIAGIALYSLIFFRRETRKP